MTLTICHPAPWRRCHDQHPGLPGQGPSAMDSLFVQVLQALADNAPNTTPAGIGCPPLPRTSQTCRGPLLTYPTTAARWNPLPPLNS